MSDPSESSAPTFKSKVNPLLKTALQPSGSNHALSSQSKLTEKSGSNRQITASPSIPRLTDTSTMSKKPNKTAPVKMTKAKRLWADLRAHIKRGFFHSVLNQRTVVTSDFFDTVEKLWTAVYKHASSTHSHKDSTTDFTMSGWAKIKAAKHAMHTNAKGQLNVAASEQTDHVTKNTKDSMDTHSHYKHADDDIENSHGGGSGDKKLSFLGQGSAGIDGLSLDNIPKASVEKDLKKIAEGLQTQIVGKSGYACCNILDVVDFYTVQVNLNRAWKLLVLGLRQSESFARHMALFALKGAINTINDTLLDSTTRENLMRSLLTLMISDERPENRFRAIYLLGLLAQALGSVREHDPLLKKAFLEIAKKILEIQFQERNLKEVFDKNRDLKVYLFNALGKFASILHHRIPNVEDLVVYIVYSEFVRGDTDIPLVAPNEKPAARSNQPKKKIPPQTFILRALLTVLNNDIEKTESNSQYIGSLFKPFVYPLMRTQTAQLQMMAVQFISKWLPALNEDAGLLGNEALLSGLKYTKSMFVPNFDSAEYNLEHDLLEKQRVDLDARKTMRRRIIRQMLQMPGSWTKLKPVENQPGFFAASNASMLHTRGIVVNLPVNPHSFVTLTRVLPTIPGVPAGMTTVPPLFMDQATYEKLPPPRTQYESLERAGLVPGLPVGFTYSPLPLTDLKNMPKPDPKKSIDSKASDTIKSGTPTSMNRRTSSMSNESSAVQEWTPDQLRSLFKSSFTLNQEENEAELPDGCTKFMPKMDMTGRKIPVGFLSVSPFPGYDPEKIDKNALLNSVSAIYNMKIHSKSRPGADENKENFLTILGKDDADIPSGFTGERNPILWPNRNTLQTQMIKQDFCMNAPILLEILQPKTNKLERILTRVVGINKDLSAISVEKHREDGESLLSPGATFNIFVRTRERPDAWTTVNLQVVDDDYQDDAPIVQNHRKQSEKQSQLLLAKAKADTEGDKKHGTSKKGAHSMDTTVGSLLPVPSGFSALSDPYFAPPVNLPPFPAGYTPGGAPYFDKTPTVKSLPAGLTVMGTRFYYKSGKIPADTVRNQIAGYDYYGYPFFIPKGCTVPAPAGFTVDGIPYYDIPSCMLQRGALLLQNEDIVPDWPSHYDENRAITKQSFSFGEESTLQLVEMLTESESEAARTFIQQRKRHKIGKIRRVPEFDKLQELRDSKSASADDRIPWNLPKDVTDYFKENEDLALNRLQPIKVALEPMLIEFQGVRTAVSKNALIKYRSARGDHQERDFFIAVEPIEIFAVKLFHLRLQGEGVVEVLVTYYPNAMKQDHCVGSLNIMDELGKKLSSSMLSAHRKSFVRINPSTVDAGWILPEKSKQCFFRIENETHAVVNLKLSLRKEGKEVDNSYNEITTNRPTAFTLPNRSITLQALETRNIPFLFEPCALGQFTDVIEVRAPGGDVIDVQVHGTAGIPIALFPEDEEASLAGAAALTRERSEFMKKFKRVENNERAHVVITPKDTAILQRIMMATADKESRKEAHTLDFYLCTLDGKQRKRCVTLMNLSDSPLTIGLYSHSPHVKCPYLIRVPPRMAHSVEIVLDLNEGGALKPGTFSSIVEIVCPDFQNIELHVMAYLGQPLYFPIWELAYFKPCYSHSEETLELSLVNESYFNMAFYIEISNPPGHENINNNGFITSSISEDPEKPSMIASDSVRPVKFTFKPKERGPFVQVITLHVVTPFQAAIPAAALAKPLKLVGICIEPFVRRQEGLDKNGIDFIRTWMSHPKRVVDEYPTPEEKAKRFDMKTGSKPATARKDDPCQVVFLKDPVVFRSNLKSKGNTFMDSRRMPSQTVVLQHRGKDNMQCIFFASTYFGVDPRSFKVNVGEDINIEIANLPPPEFPDNLSTVGFALALQEQDHRFHATQLLCKPSSDLLFFPTPSAAGIITIDFGTVEFSSSNTELCNKTLAICNTFPVAYTWSIKIVSSKTKYAAFELSIQSGDILPYDSFYMPIRLRCENTGTFESSAEILAKEANDKNAKFVKVMDVLLKGHTVNTSLTGFPESVDFGSVLVSHKLKRKFILTNNGSTEALVTILVKAPFSAEPKAIKFSPKEQHPVEVTYHPTESKSNLGKMLVFTNHKLYAIQLSGTGGTAELICEKYGRKPVSFGAQKEGTIAWTSIYLTNKGTFPISLRGAAASVPEIVKLYYVDCTNTVPYDTSAHDSEIMSVRKDYWSILRRKVRMFSILKLMQQTVTLKSYMATASKRQPVISNDHGHPIKVFKKGTINFAEKSTLSTIPTLKPFFSYHIRLGYTSRYQLKNSTDLLFYYLPQTSEDIDPGSNSLVTSMSLQISGEPFRPLEFYPPSFDFGLAPAEEFLPQMLKTRPKSSNVVVGVVKKDKEHKAKFEIEILNMSMEVQNFSLVSIPPEFTILGRTWSVMAGQKLKLPVEFHPTKEQVQYRGEAKFSHTHGIAVIALAGTGGSAELVADGSIDFGSVKFGASAARSFKIVNRGLLPCHFTMELVQTSLNFKFANDEPYEYAGTIPSGGSFETKIECYCQFTVDHQPFVHINWSRVPNGHPEVTRVPIQINVGMPHFKTSIQELDFKTTYIKVNKTMEIMILNDGNASCGWKATSNSPVLHILSADNGVLDPGQKIIFRLRFVPVDYESLSSSITFETDIGKKVLMCYGVVGVPYLKIPDHMLAYDFDIVEINRTHSKPFTLQNTGKNVIEYDITVCELKQDQVDIPSTAFDVFFVDPSHSIIPPGETFTAQIKCVPKDYNAVYSAKILVRTKDGEEYVGSVSCVGGKAIIKMAPPSISQAEGSRDMMMAEVTTSVPSSSQGKDSFNMYESAKMAYTLHMENLMEVIAGLRAVELESYVDQEDILKRAEIGASLSTDETEATSSRHNVHSRGVQKKDVLDGSNLKQLTEDSALLDSSSFSEGTLRQRSKALLESRAGRSRQGAVPDEQSMALFYADQLDRLEHGVDSAIHSLEKSESRGSGKGTPDVRANAFGKYQPGTPRGRTKIQTPKVPADTSRRPSMFGWRPDGASDERPPSSMHARAAVSKQLVSFVDPIQSMTDEIKHKMADAEMELNPVVQRSLLNKVNETILDHTEAVMNGIRERMNAGWIPNRQVLTAALRRLQVSNVMIEEMLGKDKNKEFKDESDFSLGIFKSREKSSPIILFNLPNTGNLSFDFEIRPLNETAVFPPLFDSKDAVNVELFTVFPANGTVSPGESVNICATFQGTVPGLYRKTYAVVSSDEIITKFNTSVNVGEPKIVMRPLAVDFGMVLAGKTASHVLSLSNVGTFKDSWQFRPDTLPGSLPVVAVDEITRKVPIGFSATRGLLPQGGETTVQLVFKPSDLGNFDLKYRLVWSQDPLVLEVKGVGGAAKFKPIFMDEKDKAFNGLDFQTCVVGITYKKKLQIKNAGNVEGEFDITCTNACMTLDLERDTSGRIRLLPDQVLDILVTYLPIAKENINDTLTIKIPEKNNQIIAIKGFAGVCDWKVQGKLDYHNMPIQAEQPRAITITNVGDLDFNVSYRLEPESLLDLITIESEQVKSNEFVMPSEQVVQLDITVHSQVDRHVEGVLYLKTDLGAGEKILSFPFDFRIYEKQVALNMQDDMFVGRILVGESAEVKRTLTNYGTSDVKYRVQVIPVTEQGDPLSVDSTHNYPWRLLTSSDGILLAGATTKVETIYEACDDDDDGWHNALLMIETSIDGKPWNEIYKLKLKGGGGKPKLDIQPSLLDFSHMSITSEKTVTIVLASTGTAPVNYEFPSKWDHAEIFKLKSDTPLTGRIDPGKEIEMEFTFQPTKEKRYSSILKIKTQLETKELMMTGEGARYYLDARSIPKSIDLGDILFGDSLQRRFTVASDCKYPVKVFVQAYKENPLTVVSPVMEPRAYLDIEPHVFDLAGFGYGNKSETPSSASTFTEIQLTASTPLPLQEDGLVDEKVLEELLKDGGKNLFIHLQVEHGEQYVIPLILKYSLQPLIFLVEGEGHQALPANEHFSENALVMKMNFGEVKMLEGADQKVILHNRNLFPVPFKIAMVNSKQYEFYPDEGLLQPRAFEDVVVHFKPLTYLGEDNIPKVIKHAGQIILESPVSSFPKHSIDIEGALVDRPEPLVFEEMNFGGVMKKRRKTLAVSMTNPALRMMKWKMTVQGNMKDIFDIQEPYSGTLRPKATVTTEIAFRPKIAVTYVAEVAVETDEQTYTFGLKGIGTEAQLSLSVKSLDFGVVGLENPEFKTVTLKNPTLAPIKVGVKSGAPEFTVNIDYFDILPGETADMNIIFKPSKLDVPVLASMVFLDMDLVGPNDTPDEFGKIALRGEGGAFKVSSGAQNIQTGEPIVDLPFNRITKGTRIRKTFDIENKGDTVIELVAMELSGTPCNPSAKELVSGRLAYKIDPAEIIIQPRTTHRFNFVLRGLNEGETDMKLILRTKRLQTPIDITLNITANIVSGFSALQESVRSFCRVDNSIEEVVNYNAPFDKKFATDSDVWKVLLPVIRISQNLPSMEFQTIPPVRPSTHETDISPFTVRPPAIPKELPQRAKKWYMNRISMSVEEEISETPIQKAELQRKRQALEMIAPLERKMNMEKTRRNA